VLAHAFARHTERMSRDESLPLETEVARRLARAGLEVPDAQRAALARFLELLMKWNRVFNLTGIRDLAELVDRHLIESLALKALLKGERIADVGTGAGLPGLPLAITEKSRAFTLIESRAKRVRFLRHVTAELALANTEVAHARAEHLRPERPFDTVLARAVAPPPELLEICRKLTAPGSILLMLTATHLQSAFDGLAPDFVLRDIGPDHRRGPKLRSTIVMLERVTVERVWLEKADAKT
jgi:16S rRNA (guanine527-N7)-methyltransferase